MPKTAVKYHPIESDPTPSHQLSSLERLALRGFIDADDAALDALFAQIETWAAGLRGADRTEARVQMLAQAIAVARARVVLLEAKRDEVLGRPQRAAADIIERVLAGEWCCRACGGWRSRNPSRAGMGVAPKRR